MPQKLQILPRSLKLVGRWFYSQEKHAPCESYVFAKKVEEILLIAIAYYIF